MLRIATLAIACTWPLWLAAALLPGFGDGWVAGNWYVITTAALFGAAELGLIVAWGLGTRTALVVGLRCAASTVVLALMLLPGAPDTGQDSGDPGLWFAGFCALPATAFALTVPLRPAFLFSFLTVGTTAVVNTGIGGHTDLLVFTAYVGYSVILGQYFAQFAAAALHIGRLVDRTEETARLNSIRAVRLRARAEEMSSFTALVHDHVLSNLSAVARGERPQELPELGLTSLFEGQPEVCPQSFVEVATRAVRVASPDCRIEATVAGDAAPVPTVVASPMVLALSELARNSAAHAGDGVHRRCIIRVGAGAVDLGYRDDGTGFDPEQVRPTAAGLRISVRGRVRTLRWRTSWPVPTWRAPCR